MVRAALDYVDTIDAWDVKDYGFPGTVQHDFLMPYTPLWELEPDLILFNPPFRLALQFIVRALELSQGLVCALVRSNFAEGKGRYRELFKDRPPAIKAQFVERVPMVKGRLDPEITTATAYSWLVWDKRRNDPESRSIWIPPCRKELERPGDWPDPPAVKIDPIETSPLFGAVDE